MSKRKGPNSAVAVAQALGVEGYSDHVHNLVNTYWMHRWGDVDKARGSRDRFEALRKRLGEVMGRLSEKDKMTIGQFISARANMSFDVGLRIGLQFVFHDLADPMIDDEFSQESESQSQKK